MGLAAAQARLLTITARKSDCEFLSMTLSHQKIALSRDMENISTDYQNALNQTKLVYDYYGSMNNNMDLTYGLLMTPSIYNDYYPKLVTDTKNRAVLNSSYAAAARAAGIPQEGLLGTPSSDVRNAFLEAMAVENIITPAKAVSIQSVPYGNTLGIGDSISSTTGMTDVTFDELMDLIKASCVDSGSWVSAGGQSFTFASPDDYIEYGNGDKNPDQYYRLGKDGEEVENVAGLTISLEDLFNTDNDAQNLLYFYSNKAAMSPVHEMAYMQRQIIGEGENDGSFLNWMVEQFSVVLGGIESNNLALQYAYNQVYDLIYPNGDIQELDAYLKTNCTSKGDRDEDYEDKRRYPSSNSATIREKLSMVGTRMGSIDDKNGAKFRDNVVKPSTDYIGFTFSSGSKGSDNDGNDHSAVSIDLNNIAQVFLTAFVEYQKGVDATNYSYGIGKKSNARLYDPDNDDFTFTIPTETSVDQGDANLEASFYDTLFNIICTQGWVENDQVDDASYMQEMMKNGMFFISSISDDGYYYQGNYSTDSYISEVTDDEAIAKAEAKYNTEKLKIQNKEDNIDMKMKNLDTEISSLTTEYDTTKSVITKSIEKSFKRYEA